ncbi:hypothetical protein [Thalassoporum mexicanum]|uniref:hypothetical protein n=1 Tax=Thalassoporum mexicanum TaxID=3457544 RepID=UPI0018DE09EF|nr:hypothetical protein [Pseudanabaena sp. PCC 7367]
MPSIAATIASFSPATHSFTNPYLKLPLRLPSLALFGDRHFPQSKVTIAAAI